MVYVNPSKTELVQREYDGKWVLWGFIPDPNEDITDEYWHDKEMLFPYRWVTLGVYDYRLEIENG
jgi:hypothetical protein